MANNNDYNYYKSEYSKFKGNYYTPGSNNNNNKGSGGKSFKRFLRAFFVFLVTFGIIAVAVFGGIKLYKNVVDNKEKETTAQTTAVADETTAEDKDKTTTKKSEETTTKQEKTTKSEPTTGASSGKIAAGTVAVVKTPENSGIYLRHNPTYDEYGYAPLKDGTTVVVSEISSDGLWAKSSNFDINGWVYAKYLVSTSDSTPASSEKTTASSSASSDDSNLTFGQALEIFANDTSQNLYMNCKINSDKVNGISDYQNPDSKVISTFSSGQSVPIYSVRNGYGKTRVNGVETWIPSQYLDFESWGHYR